MLGPLGERRNASKNLLSFTIYLERHAFLEVVCSWQRERERERECATGKACFEGYARKYSMDASSKEVPLPSIRDTRGFLDAILVKCKVTISVMLSVSLGARKPFEELLGVPQGFRVDGEIELDAAAIPIVVGDVPDPFSLRHAVVAGGPIRLAPRCRADVSPSEGRGIENSHRHTKMTNPHKRYPRVIPSSKEALPWSLSLPKYNLERGGDRRLLLGVDSSFGMHDTAHRCLCVKGPQVITRSFRDRRSTKGRFFKNVKALVALLTQRSASSTSDTDKPAQTGGLIIVDCHPRRHHPTTEKRKKDANAGMRVGFTLYCIVKDTSEIQKIRTHYFFFASTF